jgi:hypothetical protein
MARKAQEILDRRSKRVFVEIGFVGNIVGISNLGSVRNLCKSSKKFGMYCSWNPPDFQEEFGALFDSAPWMRDLTTFKLMEGKAYILFDTEAEMWDTYRQTRGADSNGIVYACLCDTSGEIITENS